MRSWQRSGSSVRSRSACVSSSPLCKRRSISWRILLRRTRARMPRARASKTSKATMEKSTAVTGWPGPARTSECLPVARAISSAGPAGRSGKSSRTMLAGSEGGVSAASLCLASQSDWLEGIKKSSWAYRSGARKVLKARGALPCTELDAKRAAAAAGALHVGIVELESRTFERLDVVDLNPVQIHGTHLVDRDLQPIEFKNLVRIGGLVFKCHVVLETGAAAADNSHA